MADDPDIAGIGDGMDHRDADHQHVKGQPPLPRPDPGPGQDCGRQRQRDADQRGPGQKLHRVQTARAELAQTRRLDGIAERGGQREGKEDQRRAVRQAGFRHHDQQDADHPRDKTEKPGKVRTLNPCHQRQGQRHHRDQRETDRDEARGQPLLRDIGPGIGQDRPEERDKDIAAKRGRRDRQPPPLHDQRAPQKRRTDHKLPEDDAEMPIAAIDDELGHRHGDAPNHAHGDEGREENAGRGRHQTRAS